MHDIEWNREDWLARREVKFCFAVPLRIPVADSGNVRFKIDKVEFDKLPGWPGKTYVERNRVKLGKVHPFRCSSHQKLQLAVWVACAPSQLAAQDEGIFGANQRRYRITARVLTVIDHSDAMRVAGRNFNDLGHAEMLPDQ